MQRPAQKNSGFTLIELLIVVVILSTLAAIVVPQFASSTTSAKEAAAKSSLAGIRSALEVYRQDKGDYPLSDSLPASGSRVCSDVTEETSREGQLNQVLTLYSNGQGVHCNTRSGGYDQGPYLRAREFPANPLVGTNTLSLSAGDTLGLTNDGNDTAWLYQAATGEFIINSAEHQGL